MYMAIFLVRNKSKKNIIFSKKKLIQKILLLLY